MFEELWKMMPAWFRRAWLANLFLSLGLAIALIVVLIAHFT